MTKATTKKRPTKPSKPQAEALRILLHPGLTERHREAFKAGMGKLVEACEAEGMKVYRTDGDETSYEVACVEPAKFAVERNGRVNTMPKADLPEPNWPSAESEAETNYYPCGQCAWNAATPCPEHVGDDA